MTKLRGLAALGTAALVVALAGCGGHSTRSDTTTGAAQTAEPPLTAARPPVVLAAGIPFPENVAVDAHGGLWVVSATLGRSPSEGVWYVTSGGRPRHVGLAGATALLWLGNQLYEADITSPGTGRVSRLEGKPAALSRTTSSTTATPGGTAKRSQRCRAPLIRRFGPWWSHGASMSIPRCVN
jgi:hypothetical protein